MTLFSSEHCGPAAAFRSEKKMCEKTTLVKVNVSHLKRTSVKVLKCLILNVLQ